jgi:hypothetical protein
VVILVVVVLSVVIVIAECVDRGLNAVLDDLLIGLALVGCGRVDQRIARGCDEGRR